MEMMLIRQGAALVPMDEPGRQWLAGVHLDAGVVRGDLKVMRNGKFFRKLWVLFNILFGVWSERMPTQRFQGMDVKASLDRFRRDVTIQAGYYDATFNLQGEMTLEARSISYSKMGEPEFKALYSAVINVGLQILGEAYTGDMLDQWVDRLLLGFD